MESTEEQPTTGDNSDMSSQEQQADLIGQQWEPQPIDKLVKVGKVVSVVEECAVIESVRSMPPLDLDTVLFKADGQPLGAIHDVFGPISFPHYSIKFPSKQQLQAKEAQPGLEVYFVPLCDRTVTKFAFVNELQKIKGSDASWENDMEPPESVLEYSDDEQEELIRRRRKQQQHHHHQHLDANNRQAS